MGKRNRRAGSMSGYRIHPQARTTPRMREEICDSTLSEGLFWICVSGRRLRRSSVVTADPNLLGPA